MFPATKPKSMPERKKCFWTNQVTYFASNAGRKFCFHNASTRGQVGKHLRKHPKISNVSAAMFPCLARALVLVTPDTNATTLRTTTNHTGLNRLPEHYAQKDSCHVTTILLNMLNWFLLWLTAKNKRLWEILRSFVKFALLFSFAYQGHHNNLNYTRYMRKRNISFRK